MTDLGFLSRDRGQRRLRPVWLAILFLSVALIALLFLRVGAEPTVEVTPERPAIGKQTALAVEVREPKRGIGQVRVELVQGDQVFAITAVERLPRPFWALWGPKVDVEHLDLEVGSAAVPGLVAGTATVRVTASRAGTWLRLPRPVVVDRELPVQLTPPAVSVLSDLIYVAQGGSEAVVYRVGASAVTDGVRAGEAFFPGFPLPGGGTGERFVLFAVPYDLGDRSQVGLEASDAAGNVQAVEFLDRFTAKPMRKSRIDLSDGFMDRVVPEILGHTPQIAARGTTLESYLAINGELRRENAEQLRGLVVQSEPRFLWRRRFHQQPNTQVMDSFAAHRTYFYDGREVDTQDHLGYDLASLRRAPVEAANSGRVIFAAYLGIYGNTVVLDHGYGLMSLYAHMSSIEVETGQAVDQGAVLGRTGETGLAGGDHLHFTVLLAGVPVDPVEWFDAKWIRDRLVRKLGSALPFDD